MTPRELPEVAIKDANILIDLMNADLLEVVADLPVTYLVTDFVVAELTDPTQKEVLQQAIKQDIVQYRTFDDMEMAQIVEIHSAEDGVSMPDCSCLYLAEKKGCTLLTGDSTLRTIAGRRKIRVHGVLWLIDTAIKRGLLAEETAADKLLDILRGTSRLPPSECATRIARWRGITRAEADTLVTKAGGAGS